METKRDIWDKLETIGKLLFLFLIPIFILIIVNRLTKLTAAAYDADVVIHFKDIYYYEGTQSTRRLSIHYIKLIDDDQTRYVLRQFVIWDAFERNISTDFRFDQELSDWHMVGDAIYDMAEDDHEQARRFWCNQKMSALERWPQQEEELIKLYEWIRETYQKEGFTWANCQ